MAFLAQKKKNKEQAINEKCLATSSSLVSTCYKSITLCYVQYIVYFVIGSL